ncbi:hypothetical protein [Massilia alkalitolerans]|uniref:hypothetical protein n=1 Tax=Massilia alkalitolerans TaxID=286638 RepID=UPI000488EFAF|nr:hypothetical protein [Massilia alkalitolerans]
MIERPDEFINLLKNRTFKEADRDEAELQQYLAVAMSTLKDSKNASINAHSRYMLAYEGLHSLATATLLHFSVRPGDVPGHRSTAFSKFCDVLELDLAMRKVVMDAHDRRNEKTYRSPIPPLTHKEAEALITVLEFTLPKTTALIASAASKSE